MTFLQKLDFLMERDGLTQVALSQSSGIPYTTISNWYKRGYQGLKLTTVKKLSEFFDTTLDYFIRDDITDPDYGKAAGFDLSFNEMEHIKQYRLLDIYSKSLVDNVLDSVYNRMTKNISPEDAGGVTYIKCYELPAAAGTGEPLGDTYYTDSIQVPTERLPRNAHICIRVHGNSMEPAYYDGDIVFVERLDGASVRVGEIGIFVLNGDGYIKRLGHGVLESINPEYSPIPIHGYDNLRCQGRVLGKI